MPEQGALGFDGRGYGRGRAHRESTVWEKGTHFGGRGSDWEYLGGLNLLMNPV